MRPVKLGTESGCEAVKRKPRNIRGREYLAAQLGKHGLSRRSSLWFLNHIFGEIKQALAEGEEVEFPMGKLKVVRHQHRTQTGRFLNRTITTYKQPFTVVLEMDKEGDRLLNPKPIPPKPGSPPGTKPMVIYPSRSPIHPLILPPKPTPRALRGGRESGK